MQDSPVSNPNWPMDHGLFLACAADTIRCSLIPHVQSACDSRAAGTLKSRRSSCQPGDVSTCTRMLVAMLCTQAAAASVYPSLNSEAAGLQGKHVAQASAQSC